VSWKCKIIIDTVAEFAAELKRQQPGVLINLHLVPWRRTDFDHGIRRIVGQDIRAMSQYADYVSPMCYSHMLKRDPEWIHSVVQDIAAQTAKPVIPSIQVKEGYIDGTLSPDEFGRCIEAALQKPSRGVVYWNWEFLSESKVKQSLLPAKQKIN
jgi:hypothetical protein